MGIGFGCEFSAESAVTAAVRRLPEEAEDGPRSSLTSQGRQRSSGIATKCHVTSVAIFGWQETCSKPVCEEFVNVELGNLMAFSG